MLWRLHMRAHPGIDIRQAASAALEGLHDEYMRQLFEHYEIDAKDPDAWAHLAYSMALDHVPAFQVDFGEKRRRPGRPRGDHALEKIRGRSGRPRDVAKLDFLRTFLETVVAAKVDYGLSGRGQISAALDRIADCLSGQTGMSATRLRARLRKRGRRYVSEARKLFPEMSRKLEE